MSSWSATQTSYPPRRSRSRSPSRGSYASRPPYPEPGFPQDTYRPEWDVYDRDRAWAAYERDRAAYEYSRRGRSRSPPPDDGTRKRRRSTSPYDRDRFDPRPRYPDDFDAHSRSHGYNSPPRRGNYSTGRRAPTDPYTLDFPASLKQFADWFRFYHPQQAIEEDSADKAAEQEAGDGSKPRNGIKTKWEEYKKEFAGKQLQTMFEHHRKSPWFAEKYDPATEFQELRMRIRKEGWKGRINTFLLDLESGKFDPDLKEENEPEVEGEGESSASPTKAENASGETNNASSTEADANGSGVVPSEDIKPSADDDMQFNVEAEEEPVETEANRGDSNGKSTTDNKRIMVGNKHADRGEEVSVLPEGNTVMIRTIPPDIGRIKLEEACSRVPGFMYLALGDPLQKRNYYRAGWIRFREDADMSMVISELSEKKIEGFKLHVTHNIRPFVTRARYAPEVASKPDRLRLDLENAKALAALLEDEAATLRVKKLLNPKPEGEDGADADAKAQADSDAVMADSRPEQDEDEDPEPAESGTDAVERRIEKVMNDLREMDLVDVNDEKAYDDKKTVVSLDLYLAYLRAAFHACYYCSIVTNHLEELQRKCVKHSRKPLTKAMLEDMKATAEKEEKDKAKDEQGQGNGDVEIKDEDKEKTSSEEKPAKDNKAGEKRDWKRNDERWLEWLDSKLALLLNRNGVDPRDYGGKNYDDELTKAVASHIKQEDEGKFRCKTCSKLFKATAFVEKHIANKHPELVKQLEDIPYFNNFALDPHHIQPFAHPPPVVGNPSQSAPPQAYGLQAPLKTYGGGDYGRSSGFAGGYPTPVYPPPYPYGGGAPYWDPYGTYPYPPAYPPYAIPPPRNNHDDGRRLTDRMGGFAPGTDNSGAPPIAGLPPKPSPAALDSALQAGNGRRVGTRVGGAGGASGPPPPPPPDAKEDPRAAAGKRVSYHDMDSVADGDVELQY